MVLRTTVLIKSSVDLPLVPGKIVVSLKIS